MSIVTRVMCSLDQKLRHHSLKLSFTYIEVGYNFLDKAMNAKLRHDYFITYVHVHVHY